MYKGMAIGVNQVGVAHINQVIGNQRQEVKHGLRAIGRKIIVRLTTTIEY
jgi:hypothetical protein